METTKGQPIADAEWPRFEPTYKEWKHRHPDEWKDIRNGFEPTYKEWKHFLHPSLIDTGQILVLSLPTRNGNSVNERRELVDYEGFEPTYKEWKPRYAYELLELRAEF